jgi:hypothetical protein
MSRFGCIIYPIIGIGGLILSMLLLGIGESLLVGIIYTAQKYWYFGLFIPIIISILYATMPDKRKYWQWMGSLWIFGMGLFLLPFIQYIWKYIRENSGVFILTGVTVTLIFILYKKDILES